jgi:sugar/nucleoside kinase (ribokinase family)
MPQLPSQLAGPIVVAGHACLDVTPAFQPSGGLPAPGGLTEVGAAEMSPGGAVSNVGLTLHKLGAAVRMVGLVGDDLFGTGLRRQLQIDHADVRLHVRPGRPTSYSVVLSPPGVDRSFLHAPGVNHEFDPASDVTDADLSGAIALHFGYPPAMKRTYVDGGESLRRMFDRARSRGVWTSLDFCSPDPAVVGAIDWTAWLDRVLPGVDLFCPSIDELRTLTRRPARAEHDTADADELADDMIRRGATSVCLKMGRDGLFICADDLRIRQPILPAAFVSANGSGDCTIAGLLTARACGHDWTEAARIACAVGACGVESVSATGGVRPWQEILNRAGL